jgi:hypothetical protein
MGDYTPVRLAIEERNAMKRLLFILALSAPAFAQFQIPGGTQGQFNTVLPTLSTGAFSVLQLDASGRLIIDCGTGCSAGGGTSSSFAAAFPATGTAAGFKDGAGNMQPAGVDVIGGATAAAYALQIGAVYNSTAPVFTTGQGGAVQMDASGRLLTASSQRNGCGSTFFEAAMSFLPGTSTSVTATATCVTSAWFNNTDTAPHTVTLQDQGTNCNAGVCQALTAFSIPASSFLRVQLDGSKFVGGIKWTADTANKVAADIIGNQ